MIGMGMIKAHNTESSFFGLALDPEQVPRVDVVTVFRPVNARVAAPNHFLDLSAGVREPSKKHTATLKWVGLLAVPAKLFVLGAPDDEHIVFRLMALLAAASLLPVETPFRMSSL
jgi:hypothetical protein